MIVVAIIAILAAIAVPAYQSYVIRTQVAEGSILIEDAEAAVWDFFSNDRSLSTQQYFGRNYDCHPG